MTDQPNHETADAPVTDGATGAPAQVDKATPGQDQSRAVAVVQKQRLIATSNVAIWDSAAFEHMGRVGVVMADSGLMSETFSKDVDRAAVIARCVMVANLAREVGANPLMLLQTASIISNKLHLEGKAVSAIITARTGVKLAYRFGVWNPELEELEFPESQQDAAFFRGAGLNLGVRAYDPADPDRFVDGYVGLWKTTRTGSPWTSPANWRRQLRYRAAPEWARAYEPGAVLGFMSDADGLEENEFTDADAQDVTDSPSPRGGKKRALRDKAQGKGQEGDQGFDRAHVAAETAKATQAASQGAGEATAEETPHDPVTGEVTPEMDGGQPAGEGDAETEVVDAEFTDVQPGADGEGEAEAADAEPGFTHDMEEEEDDIPAEMLEQAAALARMSPQDEEEEVILERLIAADEAGEPISAGHAEVGEQYLIAGEAPGADGRRLTYKDGQRFSGKKDITGLRFYAIQAPLPVEDESGPQAGAGSVQGADTGQGSSGSVTDASTPSAAGPSASHQEEGPPDDSFLGRVSRMTSWLQIKAAIAELNKTSDWMAASPADQDELRRAIWSHVQRVKEDHKDPVDQATDVTAFGVWIATQKGRDGADAVEGTLAVLKRSEAWGKLKPAQHDALQARVDAKLKSIRG